MKSSLLLVKLNAFIVLFKFTLSKHHVHVRWRRWWCKCAFLNCTVYPPGGATSAAPAVVKDDEFWDYDHQVDLEGFNSRTLYDILSRQSRLVTKDLGGQKDQVHAQLFYFTRRRLIVNIKKNLKKTRKVKNIVITIVDSDHMTVI